MEVTDLITPEGVIASLRVSGKKQALQELAKRAAEISGEDKRAILQILIEREKLGTTGIGQGIAIPHGKIPGLDRLHGLFARLDRPVEFDSIDGQPVDLICLLLAPDDSGAEHLKALARVSRLLRNPETCKKLRGSETEDGLYAVLATEGGTSEAA
ncbi:PTS IIA-like nitrogen regulatory protein PtsN [Kiloniella sp. b19]|uniref:PTS IIA-like nitrogen regulatory protein PtsN n=1 Tax=Kiloniella sp. GXU_MW_B19 TaxID=3141326 RepID=UPI0031DDD791